MRVGHSNTDTGGYSFYNKQSAVTSYDKDVTKFREIDGSGVFFVCTVSAIVALLGISSVITDLAVDAISGDIIVFYNVVMILDAIYMVLMSSYVYLYYRRNKRADLLVAKFEEVDATLEEAVYIIREIYHVRPGLYAIQSAKDIKNFLMREGTYGLIAIAIAILCIIGSYVSYMQCIVKPLTAYANEHHVTFDNIVTILDKDTVYIESANTIVLKTQIDSIKKQQRDEILSKVINQQQ